MVEDASSRRPTFPILSFWRIYKGTGMRAVIQRVRQASVTVDGKVTASIGCGLLVLLGVAKTDREADAEYLAAKIASLRIFPDEAGKMNRSIGEAGGALLVVSQFTLYGDCRKGRRPSFDQAAAPADAERLYEYFISQVRRCNLPVQTGVFQAHMDVALINDGPVTFVLDSNTNSST